MYSVPLCVTSNVAVCVASAVIVTVDVAKGESLSDNDCGTDTEAVDVLVHDGEIVNESEDVRSIVGVAVGSDDNVGLSETVTLHDND